MARPRKHDGVVYRRKGTQFWWMRYWDGAGRRLEDPTHTADWKEAQKRLRERLNAREEHVLDIVHQGERTTFQEWTDTFLEHYSRPPLRSKKTHVAHRRAATHLNRAFGRRRLAELSPDAIEAYLRARLQSRIRRRTQAGVLEKGLLKPSTVHQELRVLRRMMNIAVRKRLLPSNPGWGVEFPVAVRGLFRPHDMSWSEQAKIEAEACRCT